MLCRRPRKSMRMWQPMAVRHNINSMKLLYHRQRQQSRCITQNLPKSVKENAELQPPQKAVRKNKQRSHWYTSADTRAHWYASTDTHQRLALQLGCCSKSRAPFNTPCIKACTKPFYTQKVLICKGFARPVYFSIFSLIHAKRFKIKAFLRIV